MYNLFSVFGLFAGVYLTYAAITGKGQLFQNSNIKKGMEEQYRKNLRICAAFTGPIMAAQGVVDYIVMGSQSAVLRTVSVVLFVCSLLGIGSLFFFSMKATDRERVKRQREGTMPAPRAAFEFDEENADASASHSGSIQGNKRK